MSFCSFDKTAAMYGVTPIENVFLLDHLPSAPAEHLRVYLYMRMLCLHPELGESLQDVAHALHMEEDAVFNAMSYWERQGLVRRMTDRPPTYSVLPVQPGAYRSPMEDDYYEFRDFNANLQALFGSENLLHPKQYEMANDWLTLMGLSQEAVLKMTELSLSRTKSKKPELGRFFKKLNETAASLAERGYKTAEDVERAMMFDSEVEKIAQAVMRQFSMGRPATVDELKLVSRWVGEWGCTQEQILDACKETTRSRNPSMAYLNSILENRRNGENDLHGDLKKVLQELGVSAPPTPDQLKNYAQLLKEGFEPDTVLLAAIQCARKNKHSFEELKWMLAHWKNEGLFRRDAAEAYVRSSNQLADEVRALFQIARSEKRPQLDDIELYKKWKRAMPQKLIEFAAECAHGMQLPMRYIDKLLSEWQKSGVSDVDAARRQHTARPSASGSTAPGTPNPTLNYQQHTYTPEDDDSLFLRFDGEEKS